MTWSVGLTIETLHVLAGAAIVGSQLLISAAAWRRPPDDPGPSPLAAFERFYRIFAFVALLATAAFGAWLLRYTLVSTFVLVSTPYGPVLVAKIVGSLAMLLYLVIAPRLLGSAQAGPGTVTRRVWALVGAVIVIVVVGLSTSMRYL